jgi:hypothetical protein
MGRLSRPSMPPWGSMVTKKEGEKRRRIVTVIAVIIIYPRRRFDAVAKETRMELSGNSHGLTAGRT